MNRIKNIFNNVIMALKISWQRYPETLIMTYICGIIAMFLIHFSHTIDEKMLENLTKLEIVLATAVPYYLLITAFTERYDFSRQKRFILDGLGIVLMVALYFSLPNEIKEIVVFRLFVLNVCLYLGFTLVPFYLKRSGYVIHVTHLINRVALTLLYSLVMYIGLAAILFTVDNLLGISIDYKIYADISIIIASMFAPTFFLGDIIYCAEETNNFSFTSISKVLFAYIVMPLVLAYTAILYAYFVKQVIIWQMPKNMIVHLVLWYAIIAILTLFFSSEYRQEYIVTRFFQHFMPWLMVLPLTMLFFSLYLRISSYGFTTQRYFVLALSIWVVVATVYLIIVKHRAYQYIAIGAIIVMMVSMYGPLNAFSVSKHSQLTRFENFLIEKQMLVNGKIVARQDLSIEDKSKIVDFIRYFDNEHALSDVPYLPDDFIISQDEKEVFGFANEEIYGYKERNKIEKYYYYNKDEFNQEMLSSIDIAKYENAVEIDYSKYNKGIKFYQIDEDGNLILSVQSKDASKSTIKISLDAYYDTIKNDRTLNATTRQFNFNIDGHDYLLIVDRLNTLTDIKTEKIELVELAGVLYY